MMIQVNAAAATLFVLLGIGPVVTFSDAFTTVPIVLQPTHLDKILLLQPVVVRPWMLPLGSRSKGASYSPQFLSARILRQSQWNGDGNDDTHAAIGATASTAINDDFSTSMDANAMVELQKRRALDLFDTVCQNNGNKFGLQSSIAVPEHVQERVRNDLKQGRVPPIFHALVRHSQGRPMFPADTHPLLLSNEPVHCGIAEEKQVGRNGTDRVIEFHGSDCGHDDIASIFLTTNGTTQRVAARRQIKEIGTWRYSARETQSTANLVNTAATMLGADVEATEGLADIPFIDVDVQAPYDLLTRPLSRGVVASCFDSLEQGSQRAITGSPGIGKTWTLLYALQQALLYDNAVVVLFLQKESLAICYIRKDSCIYAWVNFGNGLWAHSLLMGDRNVVVLLDPREASDGGAKYVNAACRLVFAATHDERHFFNDIFKTQKFPLRFLAPWTKDELRAALPKMTSQVKIEKALTRADNVGGLPNYLISNERYHYCQVACRGALDAIVKDNPGMVQRVLESKARVKFCDGRIFLVHAAIGVDETNEYAEDGMNHNGAVDRADCGNIADILHDDSNDSLAGVGYEGEGVLYTKRQLRFVSPKVVKKLIGPSLP